MRISKDAEARRNEILDAADRLFGQKGFDGTSTNDILASVGIARGTLYYHFKSKEDIMDALIARYNQQIMDAARTIAADHSLPVLERLTRAVLALNLSGPSDQEIMNHIHKPQNALMHHKIQQAIITSLTPILTEIIEDGITEGIFHTPYPYACMEWAVIYANTVFDGDMIVLSEEERAARITAFIYNLERLLDAKSGSLLQTVNRMFGQSSSSA